MHEYVHRQQGCILAAETRGRDNVIIRLSLIIGLGEMLFGACVFI
jgi:hypothetical protein